MTTVIRIIQEAGHWCAVLPLLACFVQMLRKRDPSPDAWLLSCAFFVSFIADSIAAMTSARGLENWWLVYFYTPVQFALFVAALAASRAVRTVGLLAILAMAIVSVARGTLGAPETIVQVLGGALVGLLALDRQKLGRYLPALLVYCWATIPFLVMMGAATPSIDGVWIWAWGVYQAVRVFAIALMVGALIQQPVLQLVEVNDGPAAGRTAGGWRRSFGPARRDPHHAMEPAPRKAAG